jgi:hypothetical protein
MYIPAARPINVKFAPLLRMPGGHLNTREITLMRALEERECGKRAAKARVIFIRTDNLHLSCRDDVSFFSAFT